MKNPQADDWNHFWKSSEINPSTKPSWSKKRIITVMGPFIKEGMRALDAGCGSGYFSNYFCFKKMQTTSLDYSEDALVLTRRITNNQANIIKKDLTKKNLAQEISERFDLIFSDGLLEHFSKEHQMLIMRNFIELLSPNGMIITFVPNLFSPWELIRPFYMPGINEKPFVLRGLVSLQKECRLRILQAGGINTLPFVFSPDKIFGSLFGMLLYTIAKPDGK